jgi:hypothetical protein
MVKPKFVIGIGSQRAGSTLLHKVLNEATDIFMHPIKELHYFDTLFDIRNETVLKNFCGFEFNNLVNGLINSADEPKVDMRMKCKIRSLRMLKHRSVSDFEYIELYRPCLAKHSSFGEITPEYMILPENGIKALRESVGEDAKIILLSRNPVERFISSVKLLKLYGGKKYDFSNFSNDILEVQSEMPTWMAQQDLLNDYNHSLSLYKKYFKNVLFVSFERMIEDPMSFYHLLSDFLGTDIDKNTYDTCFNTKVNSIAESVSVSEDVLTLLEERYAQSTAFLKKMGHI